MADEKKVVWILGAAFSKSLGGPLLSDMLSQQSWLDLRERYPDKAFLTSVEAKAIYRLYAHGTKYREGWYCERTNSVNGGISLWRDAEHFLEYLDLAQSQPALEDSLKQLALDTQVLGRSLPSAASLFFVARQVLAAECSVFLKDNPLSLERWDPYLRWLGMMSSSDTIVTFNYDLVVESLLDHAKRPVAALGTERNVLRVVTENNVPLVVKLHGSVDWEHDSTDPNTPYKRSSDPEFSLNAPPGTELCMCVPGASKKLAIAGAPGIDGKLGNTWYLGMQAVSEADAIVFLGYRCPPSDSGSRSRLTEAVRGNARRRNINLPIHLVLGNDTSGINATSRLQMLLRFAGSPYADPRATMLFVEDFLDVFERHSL